ncbi:MAG: hypothetical protein JNM59_04195 [Hyphomonadaceae bacterium]|nr:hypothetical protein [Hyphomonadaceae bacterium]
MIRVLIVLPLYLACLFLLPQADFYQAFHDSVAGGGLQRWHLIAYGAALVVGVIGAAIIEFGLRPEGFGVDSILRVLRMGLIGLILTGGYQLFAFYTSQPLSVFALVVPLMFMAAEIVYEIIAYAIDRMSFSRRHDTWISRT